MEVKNLTQVGNWIEGTFVEGTFNGTGLTHDYRPILWAIKLSRKNME